MKKLLTLIIAGGMLAFYACGPSKADLEAKEKAKQDSIRMADSLSAVQAAAEAAEKARQDSVAAADARAKFVADSTHVADSLAASKGKGVSKPKKNVPKTVTAPGGRPGATKQ